MGCAQSLVANAPIPPEKIVEALKEVLDLCAKKSVEVVSKPGGFADNAALRIKISSMTSGNPTEGTIGSVLSKCQMLPGIGDKITEFETNMNKAAEDACGKALGILTDAIKNLAFDDAKKVCEGEDTAATAYFKKTTTASLKTVFLPIVKAANEGNGVASVLKVILDAYAMLPLVTPPKFDLDDYVADAALKGLFTTFETYEKAVRSDHAQWESPTLKLVFGAQKAKKELAQQQKGKK